MKATRFETKSSNKKTLEENARVQELILAAGAAFAAMNTRLMEYPKHQLWSWAVHHSAQSKGLIKPPSRTERRMKHALVCWFCKWAPDFPKGFTPPAMKKRRNRPQVDLDDPFTEDFKSSDELDQDGNSIHEKWL
jgi:hypothetical protein